MQFPHLSDTSFPDLDTVNVYQFRNTFDYSRWTKKTIIKLCNVLWNSSYSDVVKFDTDELRDSWFDSLNDSWSMELTQSARVVPEGYVKLPIPYDVLARYNYLYIDMPIATSADAPIDYENPDGIRRWYFFINNIQYLSASTTQAFVALDVWTNFQNKIDIPYMLLERGHAPVAASDTDTYLANPIANNRYLLAPDVDFDNAGIIRSSVFVPFGNGTKYVCIATTVSPDLISTLGVVTANSDYNPTGTITYSDINVRYGHQLQVNGLSIGNGRDYSQANTPAKVGYSDGKIANNLTVYAIAASECYGNGTFFADILSNCPQFLTTVQACFVVDDACITRGTAYTIAGHTLYKCTGKQSTLLSKALTKADFNYPQELQRFAKLYTSPYAQLEITDNNGISHEINIEETTTLTVKSVVSIAFPYINERVYIDGIGGVGSQAYSWVDLNGNTSQLNMPNSDWFKYCFDWQIPTFALYMNGETAFQLESFNRNVKQAIQQGLVDYHNAMRSANTAYENACDQADAAYTNTVNNAATGRDNSYRSADTGKTNTDALADTTHTNAYNTANTNKTNADNVAATEKTNADNTADAYHTAAYNVADTAYNNLDRTCTLLRNNVGLVNAGTAYNEEMAITGSDRLTYYSNQAASNAVYYANQLVDSTTDLNIQRSTATTMISNFADISSAALSGSVAGAVSMAGIGTAAGTALGSVAPGVGNVLGAGGGAVGGAVIGGLTGAVGGAISAVANNQSLGVTTNTSQSIASAQTSYNSNTTSANISFANDMQDVRDDVKRAVYLKNADIAVQMQNNSNATSRQNGTANTYTSKTNANLTQQTTKTNATNTKTTANTNAANTATTAKDNADNTQTVTKANATRTKDTSRANALDTYTVTSANANRTKTNVKDNSSYTRQVAELNAKEILENGKRTAMSAVLDARNSAPIECCSYSGNPAPDYMETRGIQIKVKTQSDSAIRQAGDIFARFGYNLNQIWDVSTSGLKLMQHFTYWKATEIWVDDREASNNAVNTFIRKMFLKGVTVWNDPTEIGKINVYTN